MAAEPAQHTHVHQPALIAELSIARQALAESRAALEAAALLFRAPDGRAQQFIGIEDVRRMVAGAIEAAERAGAPAVLPPSAEGGSAEAPIAASDGPSAFASLPRSGPGGASRLLAERALMFTALQGIRSAHREPWPGGPQEFPAGAPRCIVCGCTNERRCAGGCSWYVVAHASRRGLCTACLGERLCGVGGYLALLNAKGDDVVTFRTSCHCPVCRWVVAEAELRAGAGPRPMCRGEVQS